MRNIPPIIKNLIILNGIMLVLTLLARGFMIETFALFSIESDFFRPYQLITHMFMHGDFLHLFFNMYSLWIFGSVLENVWGPHKFFLYYMVTGLGAAVLHSFVIEIELSSLMQEVQNGSYIAREKAAMLINTPTVGASGAVFGVLLGYGMLFPNNVIQLIFPPIALKAKWFVMIFGVIELTLGFTNTGSNIAHFAHLGGMLFGYLLILYWKKNNKMYY